MSFLVKKSKLGQLVVALLLSIGSQVYGQINLDSLSYCIKNSQGSSKVDCLNALSRFYICQRNDSAVIINVNALELSKQSNYNKGNAEALANYAGIEIFFRDNFPKGEELAKQAITLLDKSEGNKIDAYYFLAYAQYAQSDFSGALENLNLSINLAEQAGDRYGQFQSLSITSEVYRESGNYVQAFEYAQKALANVKELNLSNCTILQHLRIGDLFSDIEDYETALHNYKLAYKFVNKKNEDFFDYPEYAELFTLSQQYDSALLFYNKADTLKKRNLRLYLTSIGDYYIQTKNYPKALSSLYRALDMHKNFNDINQIMITELAIARAYLNITNYQQAEIYSREALKISNQTNAKQIIRNSLETLWLIFDRQNKPDSAYQYYKRFISIKESIINENIKTKVVAYNAEQKIELLKKENELNQAKIKQSKILIYAFSVGLLIAFFSVLIILRNGELRRKNEKQKFEFQMQLQQAEGERTRAELLNQKNELQVKALRAQMNPHFIFNALNSINQLIHEDNRGLAMDYITKFSILLRTVLQNSQSTFITINEELEALRLYLKIESLRFKHKFHYEIKIEEGLNKDKLKIPPLLIQPFVENAIIHGLLEKNSDANLDIYIAQRKSKLWISIKDDGIGREKALQLNGAKGTTHQSLGLKITNERIGFLFENENSKNNITINDLLHEDGSPAGTEVIIAIPILT